MFGLFFLPMFVPFATRFGAIVGTGYSLATGTLFSRLPAGADLAGYAALPALPWAGAAVWLCRR